MHRFTWLVVILFLVAPSACEAPLSCGGGGPEVVAPIQARLELAAGAVSLDGAPAYSGAALRVDARLASDPGARALARLSDGSAVFLRKDTEVHLGASEVLLHKGEMWLDAPPTERDPLITTPENDVLILGKPS